MFQCPKVNLKIPAIVIVFSAYEFNYSFNKVTFNKTIEKVPDEDFLLIKRFQIIEIILSRNQSQENLPLLLSIGFVQRQHDRDDYYIDHKLVG
jgi:hypothetical protein